MSASVLRIENLVTAFDSDQGPLLAVDDVSLSVATGKTLALVGESGCGKSVTALSVLGLVPSPPGRIVSGRILFEGEDLLRLPERSMRHVRGNRISMIFQEPMTSLNPVFTVGWQIAEAIRTHSEVSRQAARERAVDMMRLVGIPSPEERVESYPHQLSGGMRQRVMIAMALSCNPSLLIADEPTTALDVTIQAQILDLLAHLQRERGMSILFITHDLGIVAEFASDVVVMYAGRVVESAGTREIFARPRHPYTRGLIASLPQLGTSALDSAAHRRLPAIEGVVPDLRHMGSGCRFADRCTLRETKADAGHVCIASEPELVATDLGRTSRCHFAKEL